MHNIVIYILRDKETNATGDFSTGVFSEDMFVPSHNEENVLIPVRIYIPKEIKNQKDLKFPVLFYMHGGGFVIGSAFTQDNHILCEELAKRAKVIIISIDYRLAPEHPFPAAPEDCFSVLKWALSKNNKYLNLINEKKIFLAGDSAGGNLTPNLSLMVRDRKLTTITYQISIYPAFSFERRISGYTIPLFALDFFFDSYLPNPPLYNEKYLNPLNDTAIGVPPTFIITCEYDHLKRDGIEYFEFLKKGGIDVKHKNFKTLHGFLTLPIPDSKPFADEALQDIINELIVRS